MKHPIALALLVGCTLAACGGGTPKPKDESEATGDDTSSASPAGSSSSAAASDDSTSPPPAASSAAASSSPPPTTGGGDSSGDIKAGGDDPWLAAHQMPPKDVMKVMKGANAKVHACWKSALKNDPSTSGEVKIRLVITNDGKVRVWRDDGSSMSDEEVTKCVGGIVEKLKFPKQQSPGDAWGIYSIHFAP
jgi:hypothetical protein